MPAQCEIMQTNLKRWMLGHESGDMNLETFFFFVCVCVDGFLSLKVSDKNLQPQIQILYLTVLYDFIL